MDDLIKAIIIRLFGRDSRDMVPASPAYFLPPGAVEFKAGQGCDAQQALENQYNFAWFVNQVPGGSETWQTGGTLVWDIYETILDQAVLASAKTSPSQEKLLASAHDTIRKYESAYLSFQDKYSQAKSSYNLLKIQNQGKTWDEGAAREKVDAALNDWVTKGYKNQVEQGYAEIDQISGSNPYAVWQKWKDQFGSARLTGLENQTFYTTGCYPADFSQSGSWLSVSMGPSEIAGLGLGKGGMAAAVSRIEFSVQQVGIIRSWLNNTLFTSRFWMWPPDNPRDPVCDGKTPDPGGSMTRFAQSFVVIKDLKISWKTGSGKTAPDPSGLNLKDDGAGGVTADGMQIIGFFCKTLPQSPHPDPGLDWPGAVKVSWENTDYHLFPGQHISRISLTIKTGSGKLSETGSYIHFRLGDKSWSLDHKHRTFKKGSLRTFGPWDVSGINLTVDRLPKTSMSLTVKKWWLDLEPAWDPAWLELSVDLPGIGCLVYKKWNHIGWLNPRKGEVVHKLQ